MAKSDKAGIPKDIKFEDALEKLEDISDKLADEEVPLEEAIALYEEGIAYFKKCREILEDAERRISIIEDGTERDL